MKPARLLLLFAFLLAFARPAAADELLFSFTGFDYQDPNFSGTYLDLGEGYRVVGFMTSAGPLLNPNVDFSSYEYTFYLRNLSVNGRFFTFPNLTVTFANNGRASYYQDDFPGGGGTAGTYGTNPPNATAPSTFIDGSERITGDVDNFVLVYNFSTNQGSFAGNMTIDGGADLTYVPVAQRAGWTLGGLLGPPNATIPAGYDHQVDGECRIPDATPVVSKTWGAIKALYRKP
jgi:hypothetical protein